MLLFISESYWEQFHPIVASTSTEMFITPAAGVSVLATSETAAMLSWVQLWDTRVFRA